MVRSWNVSLPNKSVNPLAYALRVAANVALDGEMNDFCPGMPRHAVTDYGLSAENLAKLYLPG